MNLVRGSFVVVELDPTIGHAQRGTRPCVIASASDVIADQRFPLICVVPVTGTPGEGILYPELRPGSGGLTKRSFALIDHIRSIDKRRIRSLFGAIAPEEMAAIDEGIIAFLGLGESSRQASSPPAQ